MSILRKTPYIETLIGYLSSDELATLQTVINSSGISKHLSLVDADYVPANADKGIYGATFELALGYEKTCIVVYKDNIFFAIAYNQYQELAIYTIDLANRTYVKSSEECTIDELRRIAFDKEQEQTAGVSSFGGQTGAILVGDGLSMSGKTVKNDGTSWEQAISDYVVQNSTTTEIGGNVEVDGNLVLSGNISAIKDEGGNTIIPAAVAGKMLVGNSSFVYALQDVPTVPSIIDNLTSISTTDGLSANMGKDLGDRLTNVEARGRFLSTWNGSTGLAGTTPTTLPYTYKTGDYYIVSVVGNKKPNGSTYTGTASSTTQSGTVKVNDTYLYDGTNWTLISTSDQTVTFSSIAGQPTDNTNLASAISGLSHATFSLSGTTLTITNS